MDNLHLRSDMLDLSCNAAQFSHLMTFWKESRLSRTRKKIAYETCMSIAMEDRLVLSLSDKYV